jgi:hypothetical protein
MASNEKKGEAPQEGSKQEAVPISLIDINKILQIKKIAIPEEITNEIGLKDRSWQAKPTIGARGNTTWSYIGKTPKEPSEESQKTCIMKLFHDDIDGIDMLRITGYNASGKSVFHEIRPSTKI